MRIVTRFPFLAKTGFSWEVLGDFFRFFFDLFSNIDFDAISRRFWMVFGRVLGGFGEGFGRVWEDFGGVFFEASILIDFSKKIAFFRRSKP